MSRLVMSDCGALKLKHSVMN